MEVLIGMSSILTEVTQTVIQVAEKGNQKGEKMKNIQIIDGAANATFDIFEISEESFKLLFPNEGQEIEFSEDFFEREGDRAQEVWSRLWDTMVDKSLVQGIHGTLFCGLPDRRKHFKNKAWDD